MESLLTIREVARYLKLDPQTVSRKAQKGQLPGVKIGNRWRFRREEINHWLESFKKEDQFTHLKEYVSKCPEINLVYLFGSQARGEQTESSDTDIAVLFTENCASLTCDQILSEMARHVSGAVDVVSLNDASSLLKYEVISDGQLIYKRLSGLDVARFELSVYREYYHFERMRRLQLENLGA